VPDPAEQARALFPIYEEGGVEAILPLFHPDVTWMAPPEWMDQPVYCGHRGLRDLDAVWRANFDEFGLDLEEIRSIGERVIALMHMHGRIKGSDQQVEQRVSWVIDFDDEARVTHLCAYFSWEEALESTAS
jgi:ketosteroid isomerase-like protein